MGFEAAPPNNFRASALNGPSAAPLVAEKTNRAKSSAAGLADVKVTRSESRMANQRGGDRHRLTDEQAMVRRKGRNHVVDLINLSHGGAMVSGKFKAKLWDRVELVLGASTESGSVGEIECAVRWMRGDRIGLEFAHETRVDCDSETFDELLRQVIRNNFPDVVITQRPPVAEEPEKRVETRHPLVWSGILHHDYDWDTVRLRNISTTGGLIECSATLPVGVTVYLDLDAAGRIEATVTWSRGNQAGLEFHQPFDVRSLAKAVPEVAPTQGSRPNFAGEGHSDQSPWAPQWKRLSVDQLGASLGD
jgi:hypothetical protein